MIQSLWRIPLLLVCFSFWSSRRSAVQAWSSSSTTITPFHSAPQRIQWGSSYYSSRLLAHQQQNQQPQEFINAICLGRRQVFSRVTAATTMGVITGGGRRGWAFSIDDDKDFEARVRSALSQPTAERPALSFPPNLQQQLQEQRDQEANGDKKGRSNTPKPIAFPSPTQLPILLALDNELERPLATDLLTIRIFADPPPSRNKKGAPTPQRDLVGGAKVPISKLKRFPTQVVLGPNNAAAPSPTSTESETDRWNRLTSSQDLWIDVTITSSNADDDDDDDTPSNSSSASSSVSLAAVGLSKLLLTIPGLDQSIPSNKDIRLRVPASLLLTKPRN